MSQTSPQIRFDDGAGYERGMGVWSRTAGELVLDWLAPAPGLDWVDVGCGNGAFTALAAERCAPRRIAGIDPSPAQIEYAQARPALAGADLRLGDAQTLPFAEASFDVAAMALVIFFVPDPPRGVAEMARVLRPGGRAVAYAWEIEGGGFPFRQVWAGLEENGLQATRPPRVDAARAEALQALWSGAGFVGIDQRTISVERRFADFDEFWTVATLFSSSTKSVFAAAEPALRERVRESVHRHMPAPAADGSLTLVAHANAIVGTKP